MFDSYDPSKTTKELDEAPKTTEEQIADANGGIIAKVKFYKKKSLKERVLTVINNVRKADKESYRVFWLSQRLNGMYVLQGLVGLFSLTMYQPMWTSGASLKLSVAISDQRAKNKIKKEASLPEDEKTAVEKPKDFDDWLKKFQEQ
jgi:hypothetical protein